MCLSSHFFVEAGPVVMSRPASIWIITMDIGTSIQLRPNFVVFGPFLALFWPFCNVL